jgi:hypothetical protein
MPGVIRDARTAAFSAETMEAAYGMPQLIVLLTQIGPEHGTVAHLDRRVAGRACPRMAV